jgi:hypothetical protein
MPPPQRGYPIHDKQTLCIASAATDYLFIARKIQNHTCPSGLSPIHDYTLLFEKRIYRLTLMLALGNSICNFTLAFNAENTRKTVSTFELPAPFSIFEICAF